MKKTSYPLIHLLAFAVAPLFVACAHGPMGEEVDGLAEATSEAPALDETTVADTEELEAALAAPVAPIAADPQVIAAQKKINKDKKAHKKVLHPFADPRSAMARPTSAPVREVLAVDDTPKMMSQPVVRNGSTLNRYYFLRNGDTAETLSKLFYDSAERAAELVEWNGPATGWAPGKVIYYRSGKQADDQRLVSYYMEAGVQAEEVAMLPGDTLRTIASQRYGSQDSWREIAALNGMRHETDALAGGKLKMYPTAFTVDATVAAVEKVEALPNPEPVKEVSKAKLASTGITAFVHRHPKKVGIGGAALLILAGLLFAQRRRQRSRFDF